MKNKRVFLVTATKAVTEEEFKKRPVYKSLEKLYQMYDREAFDFDVVRNNSEGLSKVYNRYLNDEHKNDIVLFVHDDVIISEMFLVEHLRKSPYSVTGLAGTTLINLKADKCAWHLMSRNQECMKGEVRHINGGRIWTTVFGPTQGAVTVMDGLFIAVNVEKILKTEARFNEEFNWHHYDLSFCLECQKHNVSMGILPISVIHYGLGDSMISTDWEESNVKFKQHYCQ